MKLIFHVGAHKTATTLIQRIAEQEADSLLANGIVAITGRSPIFRESRDALLRARTRGGAATRQAQARLCRFLDGQSTAEVLFISDENIIGTPPYRRSPTQNSLYPELGRQADILRAVAAEFDAEFILTIREQHTLIQSLYLDGLRQMRYSMTADEYVESLRLDSFMWSARVDKALAGLSTRIVHYETIKEDFVGFVGSIIPGLSSSDIHRYDAVVNAAGNLSRLALSRTVHALLHGTSPALKEWLSLAPLDSLSEVPSRFEELKISAPVEQSLRHRFVDDWSYRRIRPNTSARATAAATSVP